MKYFIYIFKKRKPFYNFIVILLNKIFYFNITLDYIKYINTFLTLNYKLFICF